MKSRLARLGVLVVSVVALVAGLAPSAEARVVGAVVVTGNAVLGAGISYPCLDNPGPVTPNLAKCPAPIGAAGANSAPITSFNGQGVGALVKVTKTKCPGGAAACLEAGVFGITDNGAATNRVTGSCGLSGGQLGGTITPQLSLGTKANTRNFLVTFTGVGGLLVLQGTSTNTSDGSTETLLGAVVAAPTTGSCTNKAGKTFTVAGVITVRRVP
jgi:hypothetical protein